MPLLWFKNYIFIMTRHNLMNGYTSDKTGSKLKWTYVIFVTKNCHVPVNFVLEHK